MGNRYIESIKEDKKIMNEIRGDIARNRKIKDIAFQVKYPIKNKDNEFFEIIIGQPHVDEKYKKGFVCPYKIIAPSYIKNFYVEGIDSVHSIYLVLQIIKTEIDVYERNTGNKLEYHY